jgi:anti-anti-sigma factor
MPANLSVLKFGISDAGYLVRVEGRGTIDESISFTSFVSAILDCDSSRRVILDLSACDYLDSTFLGCLLALHQQFNRQSPQRFVIAASGEVRTRLLARTRLDQVLPLTDDGDTESPREWQCISSAEMQQRDFVSYLIDCHRRLAKLGGPDSSALQQVAEQLARELGEIEGWPKD